MLRAVAASVVVVVGILAGCSSASTVEEGAPAPLTQEAISCDLGVLPAADRTRHVVVSHPFGDDPNVYEVLTLSAAGKLARTGTKFDMGKANSYVPIAFTPNGKIGIAAQADGTLGVFRFEANGRVTVVHAAYQGGFYASGLVMDPSGTKAYVIDSDPVANGGGVWQIAIACDGTLTTTGRLVSGGYATAMGLVPTNPKRAVLYAYSAGPSAPEKDAFLLDLSTSPAKVLVEGDAFGDHAAHSSSLAVTRDGKFALVGDDALQGGNQLSVVDTTYLKHRQIFSTRAPFAVVMSPWNNAALVVNGDDADDISTLKYDPSNEDAPFTQTGDIPYTLPRPSLPGAAVLLDRGQLKGRVLVAELLAVRQVRFTTAGDVRDVSQLKFPDADNGQIVGTIGVQP